MPIKKKLTQEEKMQKVFAKYYIDVLCRLGTTKVNAGKLNVNHKQYKLIVYWCPYVRTNKDILHFSLFRDGVETIHGYVPVVQNEEETLLGRATCYTAKGGKTGKFLRYKDIESYVDEAFIKSTKRILKFFWALDCPGPV